MIDPIKHEAVFPSAEWNLSRTPIHCFGAGAVGSKVTLGIMKLGIEGKLFNTYDYDWIEPQNIACQAYDLRQLPDSDGTLPPNAAHVYKVDALRQRCREATGEEINTARMKVCDPADLAATTPRSLAGVVFLLTDSVKSRRSIFEHAIIGNSAIQQVIETRLGLEKLEIYCFDPRVPDHRDRWLDSLPLSDADVVRSQVGTCNGEESLGFLSDILAGKAVLQFVQWYRRKLDPKHSDVGGGASSFANFAQYFPWTDNTVRATW